MARFSATAGLIIILVIISIDLIISPILSLKADQSIRTEEEDDDLNISLHRKYDFLTCQYDFIVLSFVRASLLIGALIGVFYNRYKGPARVESLSTISLCIFLISLVYSPVKLLALAETRLYFNLPWFWLIFVFNILMSVIATVLWNVVLTNIKPPEPTPKMKPEEVLERGGGERSEPDEISRLVYQENGFVSDMDKNPYYIKTNETNKDGESVGIRKSTSLMLRLLRYCKREWIWYSFGFLFLIISSAARIFVPYYTGRVISDILILQSYQSLVNSVIIMVILSVGNSFFAGLRAGCFMYAITKVNTKIRSELFLSLVRQEIGFFDMTKTGDVTSRLTSDCQTMSDTVASNVNIFMRSLIMFIGSVVVMARLSWQMTLMVFIAIPIIAVISKVYGKYYEKLAKEGQDTLARSNEVADEVISSMRTVRSFANELGESHRYDQRLISVLKVGWKKSLAFTGYTWINELFDLLILVGVLWYGGHLVITGKILKEDMIGYLLYQMQLGETLFNMGSVYTGLMQAVGASRKVFELIDRKPTILNAGVIIPDEMKGKIEFRNVSFAYPSRPDFAVLDGVTFTINPGEVVALVGPSGGGKSSCISLLEHFYEPISGDIYVDGIPVRLFDHAYFHKMVALVGQEPILYARPIKENIAYGLDKNEYTEESVIAASKFANADNFVVSLTSGYDTDVGEKGVQLSGGQKQRIAIARAIVRNPKVLLLDEATSALDAESEFLVQQALYKLFTGHTVLLIAHRLSTVEKANRIIVIDGGRVVQEGTHKELLNQDGLYKSLVQRQLLGKNDRGPTSPSTKSTA